MSAEINSIYAMAIDSQEYNEHMNNIKYLGSEIMKLLGSNKDLLAKYERSMWLAEEICIKLALNRTNV